MTRFQYSENGVPLARHAMDKFDTRLATVYLDGANAIASGAIKRYRYMQHGIDDLMFVTGTHTAPRNGTAFSGGLMSFHKTQLDTLWKMSYMSRCYHTTRLRNRVLREPDGSLRQEFCLRGHFEIDYTHTIPPEHVPANDEPKVFCYDYPSGGGIRDRFGFSGARLNGLVVLDDIAYSDDRRYLLVLYEGDRILSFDPQTQRYIDGKQLTFGGGIQINHVRRPGHNFLRAPDDRLFLYASESGDATRTTFIEVKVSPAGELSFVPRVDVQFASTEDMRETFSNVKAYLPDYENGDGSYDLLLGQNYADPDTDFRLIDDFIPPRRHDLARSLNVFSFGVNGATISGGKPGTTPYRADCGDGETVHLTANAPAGFVFEEWQDEDGNSLGAGTLQIDMTLDRCIMAVFTPGTGPTGIACPADRTLDCDASTDHSDTGTATATFNCGTASVIQFSDTVAAGTCAHARTILRVWMATDACGNSASCTQILTIVDSTAPVIACPADLVLACDASTNTADTGLATATDNCDNASDLHFADTVTTGACAHARSITRVWTATDACGNAAACTQTLTIVDSTAPVIACPADLVLECDASTNTGLATATDNCDNAPDLHFADTVTTGVCAHARTITRVWMATDICGNTAACTQILTIVDTTPPAFAPPPDLVVECGAPTSPVNTGTPSNLVDNCGSVISDFADTAVPTGIERVWTLRDACGNAAVHTQFLDIVDTTAPTFDPPTDAVVECGSLTNVAALGVPGNILEACSAATSRFVDAFAVTCGGAGILARIWTVEDDVGNVTTHTQTITIIDTLAPDFDVPSGVTVNFGDLTDPSATGTASNYVDACGLGSNDFVDVYTPFGSQAGIITRSWRAWDSCGNTNIQDQLIEIVSTNGPFFDLPLDATIECDGGTNFSNLGTISNVVGACRLIGTNVTDRFVAATCSGAGEIRRIWTVFDACGNTNAHVQIIYLIDTTPPQFDPPAGVVVECGDPIDPGVLGAPSNRVDNCGAVTGRFADTVVPGGIDRVWIIEDDCGNAATHTQRIDVIDSTAPVIACPSDLVLECDADIAPATTGSATATDGCSTVTVTWADIATTDSCAGARTIVRVWTATDACGNTASCTQTLTVVDSTAPAIVCPPDLVLECDASIDPARAGLATATDNCSSTAVTYTDTVTVGICLGASIIARIWTAADACGNTAACTQIITIVDTTAPAFDPPSDRVLACDPKNLTDQTNPTDTGTPGHLVDNCSTVAVTYVDAGSSGGCDRVVTRVWTVTDGCGNAAVHTQIITILASGADLQLIAVADPNSLTSAFVEVTLVVTNAGTDSAIDVVLTNTLPTPLAAAVVQSGGGCQRLGGDIICALPDLPPGTATTVILRFELDPCCAASLTNLASVAFSQPDADPTDNRHQLVFQVQDHDGDGEPDFADSDDDNDRIPDTWERRHDLDPRDATDAARHGDNDGIDNLSEYLADTDPNDGESYLRIIDLIRARRIEFPSRDTRQYTLQSTWDLSTPTWTNVLPHVKLDGIDGMMTLTNRVPITSLHYYRITPSVPPTP